MRTGVRPQAQIFDLVLCPAEATWLP